MNYNELRSGFSLSLRRGSPKASTVKSFPHLLLQFDHPPLRLLGIQGMIRQTILQVNDGVNLQLQIITPAFTLAPLPLRQKPFLNKLLLPLLLPSLPAQPRRQFVNRQQ